MTLSLCALILIIAVPTLYLSWQHYYKLSEKEVLTWAKTNRYDLLSFKRCYWNRGPFQWKALRGQEVFEISVRDENNRNRKGWLRVSVPFLMGDKLFKLFGMPKHSVIWDD